MQPSFWYPHYCTILLSVVNKWNDFLKPSRLHLEMLSKLSEMYDVRKINLHQHHRGMICGCNELYCGTVFVVRMLHFFFYLANILKILELLKFLKYRIFPSFVRLLRTAAWHWQDSVIVKILTINLHSLMENSTDRDRNKVDVPTCCPNLINNDSWVRLYLAALL